MKTLDDLLTKLESLYIPLYVKGKLYSGNNPYVINEINNMLRAGDMKKRFGELSEPIETLEISDLRWDDKRLIFYEENCYIYYEELARVSFDMDDADDRLDHENNKRLAETET
jgi:hypothetical protein